MSSVNKIIALLAEYELLKVFWNKTPKQRKQERDSPDWLRNRRIADALVTLRVELPSIIANNLKIFPDGKSERMTPFLDLSGIVNGLIPRSRIVSATRPQLSSKACRAIPTGVQWLQYIPTGIIGFYNYAPLRTHRHTVKTPDRLQNAQPRFSMS
ncbi:MAG: hypothetical protein WBE82_11735 [Xanthobacteraceae bacterium]